MLLGVGFGFWATSAKACVGCGQSSLFSPKTLGISMSFILLPVTIVGLIAWKLYRDSKMDSVSVQSTKDQKSLLASDDSKKES